MKPGMTMNWTFGGVLWGGGQWGQEETGGAGGGGGGGGGVHLILHMDEEVVRVRDQNQILPPVPTLTKASSRWPAERRDRVMSSIIWF